MFWISCVTFALPPACQRWHSGCTEPPKMIAHSYILFDTQQRRVIYIFVHFHFPPNSKPRQILKCTAVG